MYLVGSRARGDNMPSSDFDIALVIDDDRDPVEVAVKARLLRRESFPLDIVVLRRSEVSDRIYSEMLKHSKKLC
jgi:hypothetical protein